MALFNFGDTSNTPMVIGWVVCLVLAIVLLRNLKSPRKWVIRLLTGCLIAAVAFVFYASAANPDRSPHVIKDTVNEVIDDIEADF